MSPTWFFLTSGHARTSPSGRSPNYRRYSLTRHKPLPFLVGVLALLSSACSGGDAKTAESPRTTAPPPAPKLEAQVASYDLITGAPQRVLVGVVGVGDGRIVSGGDIQVFFAYLGENEGQTSATGTLGTANAAAFQAIAGGTTPPDGPKLRRPSEGVGVYVVRDAMFDKAGRWGLLAKLTIGAGEVTAKGAFEVADGGRVPGPGADAPRTPNPLVGAAGVPPEAIDSRAKDGQALPDPGLHSTSIADARAAGLPTVVVVSTPVYCVSRFCGPITDEVERLAPEYAGRVAFVHLEVWRDFEKKQVNVSAAEWIYPQGTGDLQEPWIFVVGRDGKIATRFDNLAGDDEIRTAIDQVAV